eukprot:Gb_10620 [translate_table: standard]
MTTMGDGNQVNSVAQAVLAALDWNSPAEARQDAALFLDSTKSGDVRVLANTSFALVKQDWSSEIRHYGFKMLQHLVRLRWEELSNEERRHFAKMVVDMVSDVAKPHEEWVLKSQTAALVAEVVRREGLPLWQDLLPSLVSLSDQSAIHAELVAMVLRWLPEDITVHNEDLEGDRRRQLLRGLTQSLPDILPLLYKLVYQHFGAAVRAVEQKQMDLAKQYAATVTAALNAVNAYAEWAPIPALASYGLIDACGYLLCSVEFRLNACEFFKLISPRRRPADETVSAFDSTMSRVFEILMNASGVFFNRSASGTSSIDDSEVDFAECICETMVALGCNNLQCIAGDEQKLSVYLQEMLKFLQHPKLALHFQSLPLWLFLLRESASTFKANEQTDEVGKASTIGSANLASGLIDKEKKGVPVMISDDVCGIILDVAFQHMLKKNSTMGGTLSDSSLEIWTDDFASKAEFSQYRSRLLELIRLIAARRPVISATRISQRIDATLNFYLLAPATLHDLSVLEGTQLALDTTVSAIFDGGMHSGAISSPAVQHTLHSILEGILQRLLSINCTEPALVEILGRHLDAMGPFLKYSPEAVSGVIQKLFHLLTSLPIFHKGQKQDPVIVSMSRARLQICTSFLRIARAADTSLLPHMKNIAETMACLQREGRLLRSEHNLLGEAFLIMASAAGSQQQQEVLAWLLEPLSKQWIQMEWQNTYLSDPMGLVHLLTRSSNTSENELMWSIFHTVTFFERALKRSGSKKNQQSASQESSLVSIEVASSHPMASHLSWMLPPLLKLLRCIHSLWSQAIAQALPGEVRAALVVTPAEQASLLGEVATKSKGVVATNDGSQVDLNRSGSTESRENEIRNWLKGIRDSGYNVLGLATSIGDPFYQCMDSMSFVVSLLENLQAMEFRHIRQLVHSVVIPLAKTCPALYWETWLGKILLPLLLHCQQALTVSWASLIQEGRAKVPDVCGDSSGLGLKAEVMEEKLLRDLTRETCALLAALASPGVNKSLPSFEQLGHLGRTEPSPVADMDKIASGSLIGFLFRQKDAAVPALQICIAAFTWPDSEAVAKAVVFCGSVVILAVSTNSVELQQFVAKDLFTAVIQGLTLESNAMIHADLISLCREIFIYLSNRHPAPRQVLLSLPSVTQDALAAFESALLKTSSAKEQKQHIKSLLLSAAGSQLKALMTQKNTNVITNVSTRSFQRPVESSLDEGDAIGLAAIT